MSETLSVSEPLPIAPPPEADPFAARRADIDAKQDAVGRILSQMGCEAALLVMPAHVAWLTGGMNVRGLLADTERPGVFTTGKQRWLVCSNVDTQRLFDEELDGLGFLLKEWQWAGGRAALLGELMANKKVAVDRPYPGLPMLTERLRAELRRFTAYDRDRYSALGAHVAHALEATARAVERGETEQEVAGHLVHRMYRHGAEVVGVSVTADARARKFRRSGFTAAAVDGYCTIQLTAARDGLYATASRTISFGPLADDARREYDTAAKLAAVYWSMAVPGETVASAAEAGRWLLANSPYEYEWRQSQPGYGTGWFAAEELRRLGTDDPLVAHQPVVWQARVGAAAVVDTVLVDADAPRPVTPPDLAFWPYKRIKLKDKSFDVPDVLVREG